LNRRLHRADYIVIVRIHGLMKAAPGAPFPGAVFADFPFALAAGLQPRAAGHGIYALVLSAGGDTASGVFPRSDNKV